MENLNKKIRRGFNIKLDSELDNQLCSQIDRQLYWQLCNQLESQLFWILDERLGEQLKTQMKDGKSQ